MTNFYLSIGSNLGDRAGTLNKAVQLLKALPKVQVKAVSPFYETPPWGKTDQPPFLNGAVWLTTSLSGEQLLRQCQAIETKLGRVRHEKWGARTLDIDLVYSPEETDHSKILTLPHPYLTKRAFVLVPLRDIAPDLVIYQHSLAEWLEKLPDVRQIHRKEG